jgi:hypothetical protein
MIPLYILAFGILWYTFGLPAKLHKSEHGQLSSNMYVSVSTIKTRGGRGRGRGRGGRGGRGRGGGREGWENCT